MSDAEALSKYKEYTQDDSEASTFSFQHSWL